MNTANHLIVNCDALTCGSFLPYTMLLHHSNLLGTENILTWLYFLCNAGVDNPQLCWRTWTTDLAMPTGDYNQSKAVCSTQKTRIKMYRNVNLLHNAVLANWKRTTFYVNSCPSKAHCNAIHVMLSNCMPL